MPISIRCQCGQSLSVKEQFAGRTVSCPKCKAPIQVPAAPAAQSVGTTAAGNPLNDLFDEEGFSNNIGALCPNCNAEMAAEAVLCTKCGFNKATGQLVRGHMTAGLDISPGALALERAADDMKRADKLQRDMTDKAGMPWWMLGLILFILGSATALAVMALMSANRVTGESSFNAMRTFLQLSGTACALVSFGAFVKLVTEGFRQDRNTGLLCLTVVYLFVFVFQQPKGRIGALIVMLVLGGVSAGLLVQSQSA
ncbi:hypothetical protein [Roseiconus lacunae]|uniref:Zinc ribbon domain-containing protein n=1 Tax=Roseiconus lacunae TaxID=2605694 RepID=A0ABT7PCQ1_9BACT|nr:hypothetical protein [Roseiconus lacunae]MCD0461624.1 hypothetical protein [Roseiconus lacunae]MDM4014275.1 hypothetical protein [Roseiconus lacunae]WRQ49593.1 hypothetical protein U8335_21875 [Stieleria sp. HD01]